MEKNDIILIEVSGQYEFAHVTAIDKGRISVETLSGANLMGDYLPNTQFGRMMIANGEQFPLAKAGTYVPGYASACEHFGY